MLCSLSASNSLKIQWLNIQRLIKEANSSTTVRFTVRLALSVGVHDQVVWSGRFTTINNRRVHYNWTTTCRCRRVRTTAYRTNNAWPLILWAAPHVSAWCTRTSTTWHNGTQLQTSLNIGSTGPAMHRSTRLPSRDVCIRCVNVGPLPSLERIKLWTLQISQINRRDLLLYIWDPSHL